MNIPERKRQGGAALIALAAIIVLGISWMLISRLSSANRVAADRSHNARVLADAKAALLGWVATNTLDSAENNPGRLPCPQAWADIGDTTNEGRAAANCSVPAAGWLPWRTLGLPKLLDASGQQLWYVVSPGWHVPSAGATLLLNSNTAGQLTLDGAPMVALIIAPGPALSLAPNANQLAAGCAARSQSQALSLPATPPNPLDFLECQNGTTADGTFAASVIDNGPNRVFNDQVVGVTAGDVLPGLEAAISKRIERDVVPSLKAVYAGAEWGLSSTNPVFAFAAPWASPGTSDLKGAAATFQGLLPFNQTQACIAGPSNPRCLPALNAWTATPANSYIAGSYGYIQTQTCSWLTADIRECSGEYHEDNSQPSQPIRMEMVATFDDVAMGLRALDATKMHVEARNDTGGNPWESQTVSYTAAINDGSVVGKPAGSATITFGATLPNINARGWGSYADYRIRIERSVITDHALLNSAAAGTGWFVRNEWYKLVYYATAPNHAASGTAPRSCNDTTPTCLQVANVAPVNKQRSILILAGRSLTGLGRPNGTLTDFLEGANTDLNLVFEQRTVNSSFNDRVVVVDANP